MQAVAKFVHPTFLEAKNKDGKKPHEVFTESHEELVKAAEKWTKHIASSYITMASLVLTTMFATAFAIPSLNNQENGAPVDLDHGSAFSFFFIADVASIFASSSSILFFIWIHTSHYSERDFLHVLPAKLLFGLSFFIVSVLSMMIALYAALDMILKGRPTNPGRSHPENYVLALIDLPVSALIISQVQFIVEICRSAKKNPITSI